MVWAMGPVWIAELSGGDLEGLRAATLAYFGKEPRRLSTAEAALLVALPQSPETRRPDRFPDAARRRIGTSAPGSRFSTTAAYLCPTLRGGVGATTDMDVSALVLFAREATPV